MRSAERIDCERFEARYLMLTICEDNTVNIQQVAGSDDKKLKIEESGQGALTLLRNLIACLMVAAAFPRASADLP